MRSRSGMEIPRVFYPPGSVFPCTVNDLTVAYVKAWDMNRWHKPALASVLKDGASFCYCAYVLRISGYSGFYWNLLTNTTTFLRGL